jgi:hypothetical protein
MTETSLPSPELLRKLLRYEPDTGKLFWLQRGREFFKSDHDFKGWNKRFSNKQAFTADNGQGYRVGSVLGKMYFSHRVIWAMQTGQWPKIEIDHLDQNKSNNVFSNLRLASRSENMANTKSRKRSNSKYLGVCWDKTHKKWKVRIRKDGIEKSLGSFYCEDEAARAYDAEAIRLHGNFANLNFHPIA